MDGAGLDWTLYWFMLPVCVAVATTAMLTGISGAALMVPVLVIGLPALGPAYALQTTSLSIGSALIIQSAGFASGLYGYWRRRLIDVRSALPFLVFAVPAAVAGALALGALAQYDTLIKGAYALLMLALCPLLLLRGRGQTVAMTAGSVARPEMGAGGRLRSLTGHDGRTWHYSVPRPGASGGLLTALGGFLTGLVAVGMGEVLMPQLLRRHRLPPPVAAAMSVLIVIIVTLTAAFVYAASLASAADDLALPWHMLVWAMAGVALGGQIGPRLHGLVAQRAMERLISLLFAAIGLAMGLVALRGSGVL
ncbi:MAG: sulfite exporter TauE/SafE family protein [Alphaproteobacteria bacterium]|nr:sulfite exporter TauE/SafE family protein [Alphaproteobacteria bacterium]